MSPEHNQEYAESPREGERWQDMIRRQEREGNPEEGYFRELLRSLPDEQQQGQERGEITLGQEQFAAELTYDQMLGDAMQAPVQDQDMELER